MRPFQNARRFVKVVNTPRLFTLFEVVGEGDAAVGLEPRLPKSVTHFDMGESDGLNGIVHKVSSIKAVFSFR